MRIGVLTLDWPPAGGGMSRFCVETFSEMARRGHHVTVCAPRRAESSGADIRVQPVMTGDLLRDRQHLRRNDSEIDIWHAWETGYGGLAHLSDKPMVVTVHGNDLFRPQAYYRFSRTPLLHRMAHAMSKPAWQRRMCARGLRRVACFLPNSRNTGRLLRREYPMCGRVEVVPCGVSEKFFQGHESHEGPPRLLTVCGLNRMRQRKNVTGVIRALAALQDEYSFVYDVCGEGDMVEELRSLVDAMGLGDRVRLHGRVGDDELARFYRRADLFILAPHAHSDDVEGFGIVYLEANASGTPVLAVQTGGVPDAILEGVSGFFAASPDSPDLTEALRRFMARGITFDARSVATWAERHRYERIADRYESIYRSIMDGGPKSAASECPAVGAAVG